MVPVLLEAVGGLAAGTAGRTAATGALAALAPALAPLALVAGTCYTVKKICDCVSDCKEFRVAAEFGNNKIGLEGKR
ncbi:MAG: hypothetical protein II857_08530 [Selenomonadaceae bacterium]|nr:hypothetical protein [Selenomonadaceae bacterium]